MTFDLCSLTVLVHARLQALLQPARLALVAMGLVHRTHPGSGLAPGEPQRRGVSKSPEPQGGAWFPIMHLSPVNEPPPHAALEEAAAAVAGVDAVMFAAAGVSAHFADQRRAQRLSRGWTLGCGSDGAARLALCLRLPSAPPGSPRRQLLGPESLI